MDNRAAYHKKMAESSIAPLIIKLGIPTTISMLVTNIYNLVDTYFVGTLGVAQQGATGILFTLQAVIQAFAFMLGHGAGTYMTKHLALNEKKEASGYGANSFYLGMAVSLILLLVGLLTLGPFMVALGSSETILPYAKEYGMWVLISGPALIGSLILNIYFRYEGRANLAMIGVIVGCGLNVLGDFLFITVFHMGVFGAGLSTAISQIISFILLIILYIFFGQISLSPKSIILKGRYFLNIVSSGLPSLLRQGLVSLSGGILNNITKPMGDAAIAAMTVVNRYSNFIMCIGLGVGQGLQPVSAYNYAIGQYKRVRKGLIFTILFCTVLLSIVSTITLIFPETIVSWFNEDQEVRELGTRAIRYTAASMYFITVGLVNNIALQSVRKAASASFLSLLRNGLAFVPTIFLLVYAFNLGFDGVALSQPVADIITLLINIPFFILFLRELSLKDKAKAAEEKEEMQEIEPQ